MLEELLKYLEDKKIVILGFAREGKSFYKFLRKYFPTKQLTIADIKKIECEDDEMHKIVQNCINLKNFQKEEDKKEDVERIPKLKISDIDRDKNNITYKTKDIGKSS